jgi:hypothetical protein
MTFFVSLRSVEFDCRAELEEQTLLWVDSPKGLLKSGEVVATSHDRSASLFACLSA